MINLANIKTAAATITLVFTDKVHREKWLKSIHLFNSPALNNEYQKNKTDNNLTFTVGSIESDETASKPKANAMTSLEAIKKVNDICFALTEARCRLHISYADKTFRIYSVKDADLAKKVCSDFVIDIDKHGARFAEIVINHY